jgi:hypothetical protein
MTAVEAFIRGLTEYRAKELQRMKNEAALLRRLLIRFNLTVVYSGKTTVHLLR